MAPMPMAVAAAAPPLDPPGVTPGLKGLSVRPWKLLSVNQRKENAGALLRPTMMAPASSMDCTSGEWRVAMLALSAATPSVVGSPFTSMLILMVTGTPCSAPSVSPRACAASAASAACSAESAVTVASALTCGLATAMRPSTLSVAARAVVSRRAMRAASSVALSCQSSVVMGVSLIFQIALGEQGPEGRAHGQDVVVEVVAGVVHHAGVLRLAFAYPVADQQVAARAVFEHESKDFTARERAAPARDTRLAHQLGADLASEFGLWHGVDQHRVVALVVHLGAQAKAFGLCVDQRGAARLQQVAHLAVEGPHTQFEPGRGRDHVVSFACHQGAHGDHGSLLRVHIARDDGLQRHDDAGRGHDRVLRAVRHGAVTAHTAQGDGHIVAGRHGRAVD